MKFFIALFALAAVAFAEPEADPAIFYNGLYNYGAVSPYTYAHHAYTPYSLGYRAFSPYYGNFYGNYYGNYAGLGYRLFKREAEAEADPAVFYNGLYNYGAVTPYTYGAYATPFAYNHFAYNTHALPYAAYHHAIPAATHVTQVSQGGVSSTAAIHSGNRVLGGYANAGNYVANSAGVVHVAKREAEADPALFYSNFYNYGLSPYRYAHHTYAHAAYTPYSYGYRAYNPYFNYAGYRGFGFY